MKPARSTDTTSPLFGSSGLASAFGSATSTPPCIMGAVIMKITSSSSITSIRLTTLISALSGSPSRRRRRATLEPPLAAEHRDERRAESLEQVVESVQPIGEDVVAERCRDGDAQRRSRRDQRFRDARRDGREVSRAARRDADECIDDAEHGAEQSDERA